MALEASLAINSDKVSVNGFEDLRLKIKLQLSAVFARYLFSSWSGDPVSLAKHIDHFFIGFALLQIRQFL